MKVNVLLQPNLPEGYVATVLGWPDLLILGKTKDEALFNVRHVVTNRLRQSEFVTLDLQDEANDPWMEFAGMWENDPTFEDFLAEIAAYRRELDERDGLENVYKSVRRSTRGSSFFLAHSHTGF